MGDLSPHFSRAEFDDPHGHLRGPDPRLIEVLEALRADVGRPLRIVSGFRCEAYNRSIGGARRSQHLLGRAADIPWGYATVAQARAAGARGIGHRGGYAIHVDTRRVARLVTWEYP